MSEYETSDGEEAVNFKFPEEKVNDNSEQILDPLIYGKEIGELNAERLQSVSTLEPGVYNETNKGNVEINSKILELEQSYSKWLEANPEAKFEDLPVELYPIFIPKKLWSLTETKNPDNLKIIKLWNGCISFIATEKLPHSYDMSNDRLKIYQYDGDIKENEKILMKLWLENRGKEILFVHIYDSIENEGVGSEFYTELLPKLAKQSGMRYIIGKNSKENVDFFTSKNGGNRYLNTDLKPKFQNYFFPEFQGGDSPYTIQFLYDVDKDKYLA